MLQSFIKLCTVEAENPNQNRRLYLSSFTIAEAASFGRYLFESYVNEPPIGNPRFPMCPILGRPNRDTSAQERFRQPKIHSGFTISTHRFDLPVSRDGRRVDRVGPDVHPGVDIIML